MIDLSRYCLPKLNSVIGTGEETVLNNFNVHWVRIQRYSAVTELDNDWGEILRWCTHNFGEPHRTRVDDIRLDQMPKWWVVWDKIFFANGGDRALFLIRFG